MVKRIGLTGGIGSGKSTVGQMLVDLGACLIDTDAISRTLTGPGGAAMPAIVQAFGQAALTPDGALDRSRMRAMAFGNDQILAQLESILHPMIGQHARDQATQALPGQRVVFDVPLMVEALHRWQDQVDRIVVVDCSPETQIRRVMARSGWSREQVEKVLHKQASRQQRLGVAHHVLHNDSHSLDDLQQQVRSLWQLWNNAGS